MKWVLCNTIPNEMSNMWHFYGMSHKCRNNSQITPISLARTDGRTDMVIIGHSSLVLLSGDFTTGRAMTIIMYKKYNHLFS